MAILSESHAEASSDTSGRTFRRGNFPEDADDSWADPTNDLVAHSYRFQGRLSLVSSVSPLSVQRRAQQILQSSPIRVLRGIQIEHNGDVLVLSGHVQSYYFKQMAQELVLGVAEDCPLVNSIYVDPAAVDLG